MGETLRIALAQINPHLGQIGDNLALIREARAEASRQGAALLVTPEFSIAGYPPEDLVRKPAFVAACTEAIEALAADTADGGPGVIAVPQTTSVATSMNHVTHGLTSRPSTSTSTGAST